jgi:hypothetical protein
MARRRALFSSITSVRIANWYGFVFTKQPRVVTHRYLSEHSFELRSSEPLLL